jgi:hypothetical protein
MESGGKRKRPFVHIVASLLAALFAVVAGCTALDMRQGRTMAADACSHTVPG